MFKKVLIVLLIAVSLRAQPIARFSLKENRIKPFAELGFDFQFATPPVDEVKNLPETIRNVRPHGDDRYKAIPGPIMQKDADAPWLTEIRFLKLGLETNWNESVVWKNYFDLSFNYNHYFKWGADVQKRNYTNHPDTEKRGYGAALTCWTPNYSILIPGLRSEFHICTDETKKWFWGIGYRQYDLGVITGYDRYDKFDKKDFIEIGKISETSLYLGGSGNLREKDNVKIRSRIGINFNTFDEKSKYREVDVDMEEISFFLSFGIMWRF